MDKDVLFALEKLTNCMGHVTLSLSNITDILETQDSKINELKLCVSALEGDVFLLREHETSDN